MPVPEKDPIVSKSYAAHYVIAMVILMATLFWALWDESFGQRPWKVSRVPRGGSSVSVIWRHRSPGARVRAPGFPWGGYPRTGETWLV